VRDADGTAVYKIVPLGYTPPVISGPHRRIRLTVLTAFLVLSALSAESYLVTHLNHEHNLEGPEKSCVVCYGIASARLFLEGLERGGLLPLAALCMVRVKGRVEKAAPFTLAALTPVALKTRLNF
jgi:hypothetical protein